MHVRIPHVAIDWRRLPIAVGVKVLVAYGPGGDIARESDEVSCRSRPSLQLSKPSGAGTHELVYESDCPAPKLKR